MKKVFFILSLLIFIFSSKVIAQGEDKDINWASMLDDEKKADSLIEISWTYILSGEWDKAKKYALKGRQLSEKLKYKKGHASSLMRLGIVAQYVDQDYLTAEELFRHAFQIREEAGNLLDAVRACNNLVGVFKAPNAFKVLEKVAYGGVTLLLHI